GPKSTSHSALGSATSAWTAVHVTSIVWLNRLEQNLASHSSRRVHPLFARTFHYYRYCSIMGLGCTARALFYIFLERANEQGKGPVCDTAVVSVFYRAPLRASKVLAQNPIHLNPVFQAQSRCTRNAEL